MIISNSVRRFHVLCLGLFFLIIGSFSLNAQCPDYSNSVVGTGEVCSGQDYEMSIENTACNGAIYFHVTGDILFGGWWRVRSDLTNHLVASEAIPNSQSSFYTVDTLIGPIDPGAEGTNFTLTVNQGNFGHVAIQIDQDGNIVADNNNGNISPLPFTVTVIVSSATLTVTTPSGIVTSIATACDDFDIQVPLSNTNFCNALSIDLPWNITCDSTGAVISSGMHTVLVSPNNPTTEADLVDISWNPLTCDWDVSPNNDCDQLDIGTIFTISPNPSSVPTDACNDGNQTFEIEYVGMPSGPDCVPASGITFTSSLPYIGCGPSTPIIALNSASCTSDGSAEVDNYDNTLTYSFAPTGPTINSSGDIISAVPGTNYTLTVSRGGCDKSEDFIVSPQVTVPVINTIVPTNPVVCGDDGSFDFTFTNVPDGIYTLDYDGGNFSITISGNAGYVTAPVANYDNITLSIGVCSSNLIDGVIAGPTVPDTPIIATTPATCTADGEGTITNMINPAIYTFSPTGPTVDGTGVITGATAGIPYTVTVEENGCSSTGSTFTVSEQLTQPVFTLSKTDATCGNSDGTITISGLDATSSYDVAYSDGSPIGPNIMNSNNNGEIVINNLPQGNYSDFVVTNAAGCSTTESTILNLIESGGPTVTAPNDMIICEGEDVTLTATGYGSATISWDKGVTDGIQITPSGTATFTVTATDGNCTATDQVVITVKSPPTATINGTIDICQDGTAPQIIFNGADGTAPYTFTYSINGVMQPTITSTGNSATISAPTNTAGTYTYELVSVEESSSTACSASVTGATAVVTVNPHPTFTISKTNPSCGNIDGEIVLELSNLSALSSPITYSIGNGIPDQVDDNSFDQLGVGTYNITITDQDGCAATQSVTLETEGSFYSEATPLESSIEKGESVDLNLVVDSNIVVDEVIWGPNNGLSCVDCMHPIATPDQTTSYWVQVTSDDGCVSMDSVLVIVISSCNDVAVPNSFSPNNDGLNDLQCVLGDCIVSLEFTIYNRWGEVVFYTSDKNECWDGKFKGQSVQSGVYLFKLNAILENGKSVVKSGNVNVIR